MPELGKGIGSWQFYVQVLKYSIKSALDGSAHNVLARKLLR